MTPDGFAADRAPGDVLAALGDPDLVDDWLEYQTLDDRPDMQRVLAAARAATTDLPVGAHLLAARLAEVEGDLDAVVGHLGAAQATGATPLSLGRDLSFFSLLRGDALHALGIIEACGFHLSPPTREVLQIHAADPEAPLWRRAHLLYEKVCAFGERWHHDEWATRACADLVRGDEEPDDLVVGIVSMRLDAWPYIVFAAGLLERFRDDPVAQLLPDDERALLDEWSGLPVRLLRLDEVLPGTGARFTDSLTGDRFQATVSLDGSWRSGEEAFAFLVPAEGTWQIPAPPVPLPEPWRDEVLGSIDTGDALAVGRWAVRTALGADLLVLQHDRAERVRFALPDLDHDDPAGITEDEIADHVAAAHPETDELHVLLHACAVRRIVDDDPMGTYDRARRLVDAGMSLHEVLHDLGNAIAAHLLARADAT